MNADVFPAVASSPSCDSRKHVSEKDTLYLISCFLGLNFSLETQTLISHRTVVNVIPRSSRYTYNSQNASLLTVERLLIGGKGSNRSEAK